MQFLREEFKKKFSMASCSWSPKKLFRSHCGSGSCEVQKKKIKVYKWLSVNLLFTSLCLSYIFSANFLTYEPRMRHKDYCHQHNETYSLVHNLYITFDYEDFLHHKDEICGNQTHHDDDDDDDHDHDHDHEDGEDDHNHPLIHFDQPDLDKMADEDDHDDEAHAHPHEHGHHHHVHGKNDPFCCMMGLKLGFFAGFAFGQIFFGVLADRIGRHLTLKLVTKTLIIASLIASNTGRCEEPNKYVFGTFYFIVGAASAASFLIVFSIVLEEIDEGEEVCDAPDGSHWWSSRLFVGILMTVAWNLARIFGTVLCRLCSDWELVLNITAISICVVYFTFDHIISKMPEERVVQARNVEAKKDFLKVLDTIRANHLFYLNMVVLNLVWFTMGFLFYGIIMSWCRISENHKMFMHTALSAVVAIFADILALVTCRAVKQKLLPVMLLQAVTGGCCFYLTSIPSEKFEDGLPVTEDSSNIIIVSHILSFLQSAALSLVWNITSEVFPKELRTSCTGFCSASGIVGAIIGIILGEMNMHLDPKVIGFAGCMCFLTAILVKALPDMTQQKLPSTFAEIQRVQFPRTREASVASTVSPTESNSVAEADPECNTQSANVRPRHHQPLDQGPV